MWGAPATCSTVHHSPEGAINHFHTTGSAALALSHVQVDFCVACLPSGHFVKCFVTKHTTILPVSCEGDAGRLENSRQPTQITDDRQTLEHEIGNGRSSLLKLFVCPDSPIPHSCRIIFQRSFSFPFHYLPSPTSISSLPSPSQYPNLIS
ncbi:hypothetical protein J6590_016740 [Homalodisca vitripennis]|nr:hypothetical protein J6590_016740 [Homalodisca vitripennis]